MSILGTIVGAGLQAGLGAINNEWAQQRASQDRRENYMYGEMAAQNADARTRALYNDFYSPKALAQQYKNAGLSPSLMFGGTPGQGGTAGAQGTGAAGPSTPYMPMSLLEGAQIASINAQTEKTKAETRNINEDTILKQTQEIWQTFINDTKREEVRVATANILIDGKDTSLYEIANLCKDYDQFVEKVRNANDEELNAAIRTEAGQKALREIFISSNRFETEIATLAEEKLNAKFQKNVIECLQKEGFETQNATTVVAQLKAAAESADLTEKQKEAWNRVLERLQKRNSTAADYVIVASMILNQAASHWSGMGITVVKDKK